MRIVLVNTMMETSKFPSIGFLTPPYWAAIVARKVRDRGHEPLLLDLQFQNPKRRVPRIPKKYYDGVDAVFVSGMVQTYPQMMKVSKFYKARGIKVIFGGWGPTSLYYQNGINLSDHILQFCDAAVIGEAELIMDKLLEDLEQGKLKQDRHDRFYVADRCKWNNDCWVIPDFTIWKDYKYPFGAIQTQRGCPKGCSFCSVANILGTKVRAKPVDNVIQEVQILWKLYGFDLIFFYDDNIIGNKEYAQELFERFKSACPKIRWFSQCTTDIICYPKLMDLFKDSRCVFLLFGFESLRQDSLKEETKKNFIKLSDDDRRKKYLEVVAECKKRNIVVWGCFIYGFEHDKPEIFKYTLDFALESGITVFQQTILTPQPGTPHFDECVNKLWYPVTPQNWGKYDFMRPTLRRHSRYMDNKTIMEGIAKGDRIFYKKTDIIANVRASNIPKSFLQKSFKAAILGGLRRTLHF